MMTSWDHYRYFLETHRAGSLKGAAEKLGVNQTTVGRNLSALESEVGAKLFERRSDGFVLTAAGQRILAAMEQVDETMLGVARLIAGKDERPEGLVRVALPGALADHWLIPRLGTLSRKHTGLELHFLTGAEVVNLARGEADLAIRLVRPVQKGVVARRVGTLRLGLFAHRALLDADAGALKDVSALARFPFVGLHPEVMSDAEASLVGRIQDSIRVVFRSGGWGSTFSALGSGLGIGILPTFLARKDRDLVPILGKLSGEMPVWMAYHQDLRGAARVRVVMDWVTELFERGFA